MAQKIYIVEHTLDDGTESKKNFDSESLELALESFYTEYPNSQINYVQEFDGENSYTYENKDLPTKQELEISKKKEHVVEKRKFVILITRFDGSLHEEKYIQESLEEAVERCYKSFARPEIKCIHEYSEDGKYKCSYPYNISEEDYKKEVLIKENTTFENSISKNLRKNQNKTNIPLKENTTFDKSSSNNLWKDQIKTNIPCKIKTKKGKIIVAKIVTVNENKIICDDYERTEIDISDIVSIEYKYEQLNDIKNKINVISKKENISREQQRKGKGHTGGIKLGIVGFIIGVCVLLCWVFIFIYVTGYIKRQSLEYSRQVLANILNVDESVIGNAIKSEKDNSYPGNIVHKPNEAENEDEDWNFTFNVNGKIYTVECFSQQINETFYNSRARYYNILINGQYKQFFVETD